MYNETPRRDRSRAADQVLERGQFLTAASVACITKPMATGGRPTDDPKPTLVAVRLPARQIQLLEQRSRREDTGLSEALRRCLDEWAAAHAARTHATRTKQEAFKKSAARSGTRPSRHRARRTTK